MSGRAKSWANVVRQWRKKLLQNRREQRFRRTRSAWLEALERRELLAADISGVHLVHDTGLSNTDHVTSDPTISGTVGGAWSGMQTRVEFDHDGDGVPNGNVLAYFSGEEFTYDPRSTDPALASFAGPISLRYRAVERDFMGQTIATGDWITFSLTLTSAQQPEIEVADASSIIIADGVGSFDFGTTPVGTPIERTFTVRNTGSSALTLDVSSFSLPSGFALATAPAASVAANATTTFVLRFNADSPGWSFGTVSFANDDDDENPFDFTISAQAGTLGPEVELRGPSGTTILDGGSLSLGSVAVGQSVDVTFTVRNTGNAYLSLGGIQTPTDVTIVSPFSSVVAAYGGETTLTIRWAPTTAGTFSGNLSFSTNDADENPYDVLLSGTATSSGGSGGGGSGGGEVRAAEAARLPSRKCICTAIPGCPIPMARPRTLGSRAS